MRPNGYFARTLLASALLLALAVPVQAQDYGTGAVQRVPKATGPITIDGHGTEAAWADAAEVSLTNFWNSGYYEGWGDPEVPDMEATAKLLWDDGVLYVYIRSEHGTPMLFMPPPDDEESDPNPWNANQIHVAVDMTGQGGTDNSWSGWPWNAPDQGPVVYRINPEFGGITLNWGWGENTPDPVAAGFVEGVVVVNEAEQWWAVEMAIPGDAISWHNRIGFNVGGAAADRDMCDAEPECTYAWFGWQATETERAGGWMNQTTNEWGSLHFVQPHEMYGTGVVQEVPQAKGTITIDGHGTEAAWADAAEVSLTNFWNSGYYEGWGDPEVPDMEATAKLLWDDGVLYVYIRSEHGTPMLFMPPPDDEESDPNPWNANQIHVAVDMTGQGGTDNSWSGWPWNAPDQGPVVYRINPEFGGITLNWGWGENTPDPVAAGFVEGVVVVNEAEQWWAVEMAIPGDAISWHNRIGFNVGGAAADRDMCDAEPECTYAWFGWQATETERAGGWMNQTTNEWGMLQFVGAVSNEGNPGNPVAVALGNYPNPFRASTTVVYDLDRDGAIEVAVFDLLGRRVAVLDEGPRTAGQHTVSFDGNGLASGLYVVRLAVDGAMVATRAIMRVD
jgi:hypothetical protein